MRGAAVAPLPGIEPTPAHLQHATQGCQPKLLLMCLPEPTAAFFKMSRSSVTRASSRFKRVISVVCSFRAPDLGNAPAPRAWNSRCHLFIELLAPDAQFAG